MPGFFFVFLSLLDFFSSTFYTIILMIFFILQIFAGRLRLAKLHFQNTEHISNSTFNL